MRPTVDSMDRHVAGPSRHEARIDTAALRSNLAAFGRDSVIDVSGDGYGHGAVLVATLARESGLRDIAVRSVLERDELAASGIESRVLDDSQLASAGTKAVYGVGAEPVMRFSGKVISVKTVLAGDGVSYGYTWRAEHPTALALVCVGYADGLIRAAGNRAELLLAGRRRAVVGRVAMDVCVVEIGPADASHEVSVGDDAVVFGDTTVAGVRLEDWAATMRLPPLSITAGIGARVPRVIR